MTGRLAPLIALTVGLAATAPAFGQISAPTSVVVKRTPAPTPVPTQQQRPNVLVWIMDDVGFGQITSFGGLVDTPNIDRVARMGLRYDNYHTAAICSASRAAMLTGRNTHSVNNGGHANVSLPFPGYTGRVPASAGTIAENLRQAGYATFQVGKWDHMPQINATSSGPFTYWPQGQGFERSYSFLSYDTENFTPTLVRDSTPIATPSGPKYHVSADLADQAIQMINSRDAGPPRPFFMYWASGAAHAPLHAPPEWLDKYRGKFDMGWDRYREMVLKRQIAQGLVAKSAKLAPRPDGMPAWDSLSADQKKLYARQMEAFAACLAYADEQFGRILDVLEKRGELANTMIVITSDNGASAESGPDGLMNEAYVSRLKKPSVSENMKFYDKWGRPGTFPGYSLGWAVAGNTPYRYYKQTTYEGGIHVPLVVAYSNGIAARGGAVREDFVHVSDIAPTILDVAGVKPAAFVNNVPQSPLEGVSFKASFAIPGNARDGRPQYFELYGNRGLTWQGWAIATMHRSKTWDYAEKLPGFDLPWALYDVVKDPGQTTDLAAKYPERVKQMSEMFMEQATKYNAFPQHDMAEGMSGAEQQIEAMIGRRKGVWRYPGPVTNMSPAGAPPTLFRPYRVIAKVDLPTSQVTGPIFASGGSLGGHGFYLEAGRPTFVVTDLQGAVTKVQADAALATGPHEIVLDVDGRAAAIGTAPYKVAIRADGKLVADRTVQIEIPMTYNADSFDIGADQGSTVLPNYPAGHPLAADDLDVTFDFNR